MPADHAALIRAACQLIDEHGEGPLTLADLGTALDLSPAHLQRVFKRAVGVSPGEYLKARRLERFKARLRQGQTVTAALYEAGYAGPSRVYESTYPHLGMTPGAYRQGGRHVAIRYTLTDSPLGRLLLAGTDRGVCAVYLGDEDAPLEAELAREFHAARRERDDAGLSAWAARVRDHLAGQPLAALPLDVRATAFQRRVWQELQKIPAGATRTYSDVARALGQPTAARAVARACATNPVSVVIPCHRVVRGDGGLGGYRWGLGRKRELLRREREGARPPGDDGRADAIEEGGAESRHEHEVR